MNTTLSSIRAADLICLCTTGPGVPVPALDTIAPVDEFVVAAGLTDDDVSDVDGPHDIRSEIDGRTVRWHAVAYLTGTVEGDREAVRSYLLGTIELN